MIVWPMLLQIWLWGAAGTFLASLILLAFALGISEAAEIEKKGQAKKWDRNDAIGMLIAVVAFVVASILWPVTVPVATSFFTGFLTFRQYKKFKEKRAKRKEEARLEEIRRRTEESEVLIEEQVNA